MLSCNIGPKNRLVRGVIGLLINFIILLLVPNLPIWAFWLGIGVSYAVTFQAIVGWCYIHALFKTKDMN